MENYRMEAPTFARGRLEGMSNAEVRASGQENRSFGASATLVTGTEGITLDGLQITPDIVAHLRGKGYYLYTTQSFRRARNGVVNNNYWLIITDANFDAFQHKTITPEIQDRWVTLDSEESRKLGKGVLEPLVVLPKTEQTAPKVILSRVPGSAPVNVHSQMVSKSKTNAPLQQSGSVLRRLQAAAAAARAGAGAGAGARLALPAITEEGEGSEPISLVPTVGQLRGPLASVLGSATGTTSSSRLGAQPSSGPLRLQNGTLGTLGRVQPTQPGPGAGAGTLPSLGTIQSRARLLAALPPPPPKGGKRSKRTRRSKKASKRTRKH